MWTMFLTVTGIGVSAHWEEPNLPSRLECEKFVEMVIQNVEASESDLLKNYTFNYECRKEDEPK